MTLRQREILAVLRQKRQWTNQEVAKALHISNAAATKAMQRLEKLRQITRSVNPQDRRSRIIQLAEYASSQTTGC